MKKRIVAGTVVVIFIAGIIFAQAVLGAYYITSTGQKIGYNLTSSNYYPVRISYTVSYALSSQRPPEKNTSAPEVRTSTGSPSTGFVTAGNQKIYYQRPGGTLDNYYPVKLNNNPAVSSTTSFLQPPEKPGTTIGSAYRLTAGEQRLIELINRERTGAGLNPLVIDYQLCRVARLKAEDMHNNHYFSHTSPTYGSPFEMMKHFGITYTGAAENLGRTYSAERAHQGFMKSEGHRKNILNPYYTRVGVGIYGNYYVELFIRK